MDAHYWSGDDTRDELTQPEEYVCCRDCGAREDEPCEPGCTCNACCVRRKRAQPDEAA